MTASAKIAGLLYVGCLLFGGLWFARTSYAGGTGGASGYTGKQFRATNGLIYYELSTGYVTRTPPPRPYMPPAESQTQAPTPSQPQTPAATRQPVQQQIPSPYRGDSFVDIHGRTFYYLNNGYVTQTPPAAASPPPPPPPPPPVLSKEPVRIALSSNLVAVPQNPDRPSLENYLAIKEKLAVEKAKTADAETQHIEAKEKAAKTLLQSVLDFASDAQKKVQDAVEQKMVEQGDSMVKSKMDLAGSLFCMGNEGNYKFSLSKDPHSALEEVRNGKSDLAYVSGKAALAAGSDARIAVLTQANKRGESNGTEFLILSRRGEMPSIGTIDSATKAKELVEKLKGQRLGTPNKSTKELEDTLADLGVNQSKDFRGAEPEVNRHYKEAFSDFAKGDQATHKADFLAVSKQDWESMQQDYKKFSEKFSVMSSAEGQKEGEDGFVMLKRSDDKTEAFKNLSDPKASEALKDKSIEFVGSDVRENAKERMKGAGIQSKGSAAPPSALHSEEDVLKAMVGKNGVDTMIISKAKYEVLKELITGVVNRTEIVGRIPPVPPNVIVYNPQNMSEAKAGAIRQNLQGMSKTYQGQDALRSGCFAGTSLQSFSEPSRPHQTITRTPATTGGHAPPN